MQGILKIILLLVLVVVVFGGLLFLIFSQVNYDEKEIEVVEKQIVTYQLSMERFKSRLTEYTGGCADIGLPHDFQCATSATQFRISKKAGDTLLCADATGYVGKVNPDTVRQFSCQ